jgi:tetratricopeptide (TPR) repeat protein
VIWQTQLSETLVVYSGEPPLESDVDYLLMIEADTGASSQEENLPDLGFGLLGENEAQRVSEGVAQLVNLDLPQEAKSLALVHLYRGYDLKAEAIATLEALVNQGSQTAAVYRILGDLYLETGLNLLAESRYLRAIELAAADVEAQALAAASLVKVYEAIANRQEAIRWLTQAHNRYQVLGDRQRLGELEKQQRQLNLSN